MVLGHEGVGVVTTTGPEVRSLKKGDRVGWGFLQDTCGQCKQCECGTDVFCSERKMYGRADLDQGSLAYGIVKKESRLFSIPKELTDEEAAPLMVSENKYGFYYARKAKQSKYWLLFSFWNRKTPFLSNFGLSLISYDQ